MGEREAIASTCGMAFFFALIGYVLFGWYGVAAVIVLAILFHTAKTTT